MTITLICSAIPSQLVHILHIAKTSIYDSPTIVSTSDAINLMLDTYSGPSWHYTDGSGNKPDLHHGIFYKALGGGVLCINLSMILNLFHSKYGLVPCSYRRCFEYPGV